MEGLYLHSAFSLPEPLRVTEMFLKCSHSGNGGIAALMNRHTVKEMFMLG